MKMYHVALSELEARILSEGLDPAHRAILLLPEVPELPEGFDLWETDVPAADASAPAFCQERIPADRIELVMRHEAHDEASAAPAP